MAEQPQMSRKFYVCSHATAAIAAASLDGGGVVLIAGIGSRSFHRNPDGSTVKSGGWGHKLTEVGSGLSTFFHLKIVEILNRMFS